MKTKTKKEITLKRNIDKMIKGEQTVTKKNSYFSFNQTGKCKFTSKEKKSEDFQHRKESTNMLISVFSKPN